MKETPILMCGEMVRATLEDRKTQTRRIVKPSLGPKALWARWEGWSWRAQGLIGDIPSEAQKILYCPYGIPGGRLYVRETWRVFGGREYEYQKHQPSVRYKADDITGEDFQAEWRPSIHMPKWASRLTLEITDIKVERVQDISGEDAQAEGWPRAQELFPNTNTNSKAKGWYQRLWDSLNKERGYGWSLNPWIWKITFRRIHEPQSP